MSILTLLTVLLWVFGSLMLIGIGVIVFVLGRNSIKDKNNKALVLIKHGNRLAKPAVYDLIVKTNKGLGFMFEEKFIAIPKSYDETFFRGKRLVFLKHTGQLVASPFDGDVKLSEVEKDDLIYELVANKIGSEAIRAIKGKQAASLIMIAIAAFVIGVGVMFAINQFQVISQRQQQQPQPIEEPAKLPIPEDATQY